MSRPFEQKREPQRPAKRMAGCKAIRLGGSWAWLRIGQEHNGGIGGIVYAIGGILIMDEPVQGAVVITLLLIAALVIGGVLRIVVALRHRDMGG